MSFAESTRRRFMVFMGGFSIGAFAIPGGAAQTEPSDPGDESSSEEPVNSKMERVDLLVPPVWGKGYNMRGEQVPVIAYINGEGKTRLWWPDNAEELAEMERFYAATRTPGRPIVDPQTVFPIQRSRAESDLIAAIVADPDSDAPRLAYSAWLDSRGDPRGEFIRLQCEKARYTDKQHPRYVELDKREDEILDAHGKVWYRPLAAIGIWPNYGSSYVPSLFMRRGMIERVWVFATGVLPEEGERLWQAAPALNELWHNCITDVPRLMAIPQMQTVRDLHLSPDRDHSLTHDDVEALVNSPNLRSLRSLNWGHSLSDESVALLCQSRLMSQLTKLELGSGCLSGRAVSMIASCRKVSSLTALDISGCTLDATAVHQLGETPYLRQVEALDLSNSDLTEGLLTPLLTASWPRLKELSLKKCKLGDKGVRAIATSGSLSGLQSLFLSDTEMGPEGARALAESSHLAGLTKLQVTEEEVQETGKKILTDRFGAGVECS